MVNRLLQQFINNHALDDVDEIMATKTEEKPSMMSDNNLVQAHEILPSPFNKESDGPSNSAPAKPIEISRQLRQASATENTENGSSEAASIIDMTHMGRSASEQVQMKMPIDSGRNHASSNYPRQTHFVDQTEHLQDGPSLANVPADDRQHFMQPSAVQANEHQHFMQNSASGSCRSEFSKEAEYRMNQIVGLLGQVMTMGSRASEEVYLAKSELSMEREACKQMQTMLELEKQCKLQAQEDVSNARKAIANLTEK